MRPANVWHQTKKAELRTFLMVRCDECAFALSPNDQILRRQFVDRFSYGALTYLETLGKLNFAWNHFPGFPLA